MYMYRCPPIVKLILYVGGWKDFVYIGDQPIKINLVVKVRGTLDIGGPPRF